MDAKQLRDMSDDLYGKKGSLNSLHQEMADQFYPERADFTISRSWGTDFAAHLMSSYPLQCRRELGNLFGTMLRPTARPWFHPRLKWEDWNKMSGEVKQFLQWFERTQRRAMYDNRALFTRACKEGDHDYATFGQCVLSVELNRARDGLLYRSWHLRDMVWQENADGQIGTVCRKWKTTAVQAWQTFGDKLSDKMIALKNKTPYEMVELRHFVVEADMYDDKAGGKPRFSVWYDISHDCLIEATPIWGRIYVIPRWQTVSGSQYSYSPAVVCALPDARLLQAMTFTLLEAGEKATNPPMLATKGTIRSDIDLVANGITWIDQDYDERMGDALRPLTQDFRGFNFGVELGQDTRSMLERAFYLNTLKMPPPGSNPQMTAYEVGQRVQQYIRDALPIFEPTEMEYNAAVCDETFDVLWRNGAMGPVENWPKELRQPDGKRWGKSDGMGFEFESPLHDIIEQQKGPLFQQAQQLIGGAIAMDPACAFLPKAETMLRDTLEGLGVPQTWMNTDQYIEDAKRKQQAQAEAEQKLAALESASNSAKNLGASGLAQPAMAQ